MPPCPVAAALTRASRLVALGGALGVALAACSPSATPPATGGARAAPTAAPPAAAAPASTAPAATAATQAAPAPVGLDIGIISGAGYYIPGYLATDRGFLEQEGIKGEWVVAGTPESIRSVVSGSVGIGLLGTDGSIVAVTKGASLRQVGSLLVKPTYDVIGTDRLQSIADLRG